jgi:hypothetical protein
VIGNYPAGRQKEGVSFVIAPQISNGGEALARRARNYNVGGREIDAIIAKVCDEPNSCMIGVVRADGDRV